MPFGVLGWWFSTAPPCHDPLPFCRTFRTLPGPASGTPLRLNLTPQQQAALVAFMKTLTDTNLATDPKLSDPFNYGN